LAIKLAANNSIISSKELIRELIKGYSDRHKELHANISKIGKVIDKVS
jgi:hypothetical protein